MAARWQRNPETGEWVFPPKVSAYVEWACTPKALRQIKTINEYCRSTGTSEASLAAWRRDSRVRDAIRERLRDFNVSEERIQEVIDALWLSATQGDVNAAKTYLQYVADFMPKSKVVIEDRRVEEMSTEEIMRELGLAREQD